MSVKIGALFAVAVLILIFLVRSVDIEKLWQQVVHFPIPILLMLCVLSLCISVVKASRFLLLMRKNDVDITFGQITKVYLAGQATTSLPGGEAFRALILKKEYGVSVKETSSAVIMQSLLLFVSSAIIAIIGSVILGVLHNVAFISILILLFLAYFLADKRVVTFISERMKDSKHKNIKKHANTITSVYKSMQNNVFHEGSKKLPGTTFLYTLLLGIVTNLLGGLMIYLIAKGYHVDLGLWKSFYVYAMGIIIGVVTGFVPGGLGFTEGGLTGILLLLHVSIDKAVPIVLIYRFIDLVFYIFVGIISIFLFYAKTVFGKKKGIKSA